MSYRGPFSPLLKLYLLFGAHLVGNFDWLPFVGELNTRGLEHRHQDHHLQVMRRSRRNILNRWCLQRWKPIDLDLFELMIFLCTMKNHHLGDYFLLFPSLCKSKCTISQSTQESSRILLNRVVYQFRDPMILGAVVFCNGWLKNLPKLLPN